MATPTYTLIDSVTLASVASIVTFSGISATGKGDLVLAVNADQPHRIQFNGDAGANYLYVIMYGNGSSTVSSSSSYTSISAGAGASSLTQVMDYSSTNKHKSVLNRRDDSGFVAASAIRWTNTAAITSITIFSGGTSYAAGSTFHLYQIVSE